MFDGYVRGRAQWASEPFRPFYAVADYADYLDGKPRCDGVRSCQGSHGIVLPHRSASYPSTAETVDGLGNRNNEIVFQLIQTQGVQAYPGSVRFIQAMRAAGLRTPVVSSSANRRDVLEAAGIRDLFDVRIDGSAVERDHLNGKPAPDTFLATARELAVEPEAAAVFENPLAGGETGRARRFGYVVGVDRASQAEALGRRLLVRS